jgi:hypothetical protein
MYERCDASDGQRKEAERQELLHVKKEYENQRKEPKTQKVVEQEQGNDMSRRELYVVAPMMEHSSAHVRQSDA